jgi:hypothetical protein
MPEGTCLCGNIRISYDGSPAGKVSLLPARMSRWALSNPMQVSCHCMDCKKITGSTFSTNLLIPNDYFKVLAGTPKQYTKTADSGNKITSFFCDNCGSTLFRKSDGMSDSFIVRAGPFDLGVINDGKPDAELWVKNRSHWMPEIQGAVQNENMS